VAFEQTNRKLYREGFSALKREKSHKENCEIKSG